MSARHRRRKRLEASPDFDPAKTVVGRKLARARDEMIEAAEKIAGYRQEFPDEASLPKFGEGFRP